MTRQRLASLIGRPLVAGATVLLLQQACAEEPDDTVTVESTSPDNPVAGLDEAVELAADLPTTTSSTRVPVKARASRKAAPAHRRPVVSGAATNVEPGPIEAAICEAFGDHCAKAIAVARCESRLNPAAVNGNHRGLFQVSVYWHHTKPLADGKQSRLTKLGYTPDDLFSAGPNIAVALDIFRESGWRPWSCA